MPTSVYEYDYTGTAFTSVSGSYTTSDRVTGKFFFNSPLTPSSANNFSFPASGPPPLGFTLSDGVNTITSTDAGLMASSGGTFVTDAADQILTANFGVTEQTGAPTAQSKGIIISPAGSRGISGTSNGSGLGQSFTAGTWNEAPINANTIGTYRFFDTKFGTHFFTADVNEKNALTTPGSPNYRTDLKEETNGFGAIDPSASDPNEVSVYRFFDQATGTHFFTASATERDAIMTPGSPNYQASYSYEPGSTFFEHGTQQTGDVAVYRFFDTVHGTHFYTGDAAEYAGITKPGSTTFRPDLVAEGVGFYAPAGNYF